MSSMPITEALNAIKDIETVRLAYMFLYSKTACGQDVALTCIECATKSLTQSKGD